MTSDHKDNFQTILSAFMISGLFDSLQGNLCLLIRSRTMGKEGKEFIVKNIGKRTRFTGVN